MGVRLSVGIPRAAVRTPRRGRGLRLSQQRKKGSTKGGIRCRDASVLARAQSEPSPAQLSAPTWNSAPLGKQYCSYCVPWPRQTSRCCSSGCELPVSDQEPEAGGWGKDPLGTYGQARSPPWSRCAGLCSATGQVDAGTSQTLAGSRPSWDLVQED